MSDDPRLPARDPVYRVQLGCTAGRWSFACNDEQSARLRLDLGVYWEPDRLDAGFYPPGGSFVAHDYWCIVNVADDGIRFTVRHLTAEQRAGLTVRPGTRIPGPA